MIDPYNVLQIPRTADLRTIKRAYRRLAKRYHPDRGGRAGGVERFLAIQSAYELLSDPEKRRRYDSGQLGYSASQSPHGTKRSGSNRRARHRSYRQAWDDSPYRGSPRYRTAQTSYRVKAEAVPQYSTTFEETVRFLIILVLTAAICSLIYCRWYYKTFLEAEYERARIEQVEQLNKLRESHERLIK